MFRRGIYSRYYTANNRSHTGTVQLCIVPCAELGTAERERETWPAAALIRGLKALIAVSRLLRRQSLPPRPGTPSAHATRAIRRRYGVGRHFRGHGHDHGSERGRCSTGQLGCAATS